MTPYLNTLNKAQKEAVCTITGPCMIIAGAGAGKTKVLTCRIAYLIEKYNILPKNILTLTFTNKAAHEMKTRVAQMIDIQANNLWLGTFHSIFFKILRIESEKIGYPNNFGIYDANDSKSLIKTIIQEMSLDDSLYQPNVVIRRISNAKNRLIDATIYNQTIALLEEDAEQKLPLFGKIYQRYAQRCKQAGIMDFDDLLLIIYQLLHQQVAVREKYQKLFQYILIDEFQDTNTAQYKILALLLNEQKNICVVGDDSQSIYAFRGAEINNILQFTKHFPQAKLIKLEQNYRSTHNIIQAANTLIAHNQKQIDKNIWTQNTEGTKIQIFSYANNIEEGNQVINSIIFYQKQYGCSLQDFVILYRTNSQSRDFEEALRKYNLPYQIVGGMSFYQRKEIKDFLAYLRLIANPNDEEAFKRIINFPKKGISKNTIAKIIQLSNERQVSIPTILNEAFTFFSKKIAHTLLQFLTDIDHLRSMRQTHNIFDLTQAVAKTFGLLKVFAEDTSLEGKHRMENIQELMNALGIFSKENAKVTLQLDTFLENISLMNHEEEKEIQEKVRLMTIHAAKGLEFNYVYIVGVEEGLFPSRATLSSQEMLEEERRLFYVALTRAKKQVFCSYVEQRYRFGKLNQGVPSRFLTEMDNAYVIWPQKNTMPTTSTIRHHQHTLKKITPLYKEKTIEEWHIGQKIKHDKFGIGEIIKILGEKIVINFQHFGTKTLLLAYARLKAV